MLTKQSEMQSQVILISSLNKGGSETVNLTVYCRKLVCTTLLIRQAKMIF